MKNQIRPISSALASTFVLILVQLFSSSAFAFSFSPIISEFAPTGADATRTFTAENKSADKIAVQVSAYTRSIDENGVEKLTPTDHFKIFPEQFTLAAKQTRAVRISYRGPGTLSQENAYRFVAEQLPVEIAKIDAPKASGSRLNFLIRYETSVYVQPPAVKPKIKVDQARAVDTRAGRMLELELVNEGSAHQLLHTAQLKIASASESPIVLGPDQLKSFDKQNLLAGGRRTLRVPWPAKLPESKKLSATIEFN